MTQVMSKQVYAEMLTVGSSASGFTYLGADYAIGYVDSGEIMIDCVNTPTTSIGQRVLKGWFFRVCRNDMVGFKVIKSSTANASVYVRYYKITEIFPMEL